MNTGIDKFKAEASLPSESEFANIERQAKIFIESKFLPPSIDTPAKAITIAIKGRELGIPPMQAFSHINIISGKPAMSAELMLALIFRGCPTAIIEYTRSDNKGCVIEARRRNTDKASVFSFVDTDAVAAGLLTKDTWKKYPQAMYRARCISAVGRALFPDCLMGVSYTAEELGAEVDEEGKIIDVKVTVPRGTTSVTPAPAKAPVAPPAESTAEPVEAELVPDDKADTLQAWKEGITAATTIDELDFLFKQANEQLPQGDQSILKPLIDARKKAIEPKTKTSTSKEALSEERVVELKAKIDGCKTPWELNKIIKGLSEVERKSSPELMKYYNLKVNQLAKAETSQA